MTGGIGPGTALSAGAVDAQFWALVCEDEEWLDAEFAGIVSWPAESHVRVRLCPRVATGLVWPGERRIVDGERIVGRRPDSMAWCPRDGLGRQRSPPPRSVAR